MAAGVAIGSLAVRGLEKAWQLASRSLSGALDEFKDQQRVAAQTNAVLKSTGGTANVTAKQVDRLADSLMRKSGIDDESIKSAENWLLTFKNVKNEVGSGNDIFNQAAATVVDLGVAMSNAKGGAINLSQASNMLGKALNDPVKGMTALGRAGVQFTDAQKKQIEGFVKSGNLMAAQKLILKELKSQVGGSAEAYGDTLPGALSKLRESWKNLTGDLLGKVAPALSKGINMALDFVKRLSNAKGWRMRLRIVWEGVSEAGQTLSAKLREAMGKVNWTAVWSGAKGIGEGLKTRFESIDWSIVGAAMATGIAAAVAAGGPAAKALLGALDSMVASVDWEELGIKMGPGLATAVVSAFNTLMDIGFWARHWELALALLLATFGKGIGKFAKPIGVLLKTHLGTAFWDAMLAIERTMGARAARIVLAIAEGVTRGLPYVARALGSLASFVERQIGRLGKVAVFTLKILGIETVIRAIERFASWTIGKLGALLRTLEKWGLQATLYIIEPFTHMKFGGGWARTLKDDIKNRLADLEQPAMNQAANVGRSIMAGITLGVFRNIGLLMTAISQSIRRGIDQGNRNVGSTAEEHARDTIGKGIALGIKRGFLLGSADLPANISDKVRNALERARTVVEGYQSRMSEAFSTVSDKAFQAFDAHTSKMLDNLDKKLAAQIAALKVTVSGEFGSFDFAEGDETPTEKLLREEREKRDEKARQDALYAAQASGDAQAIADAEWAIREADLIKKAEEERAAADTRLAAERLALEQATEQERLNLEARRELKRQHLEAELAQMAAYLEKHPGEYKKQLAKLKKLFKDEWGPGFELSGKLVGTAFADGLAKSFDALEKAAKKFGQILAQYLEGNSPPKKGPLSKIDKWGKTVGETYANALGIPNIARAVSGVTARPASAVAAASMGGNIYQITVPLSDVWGDPRQAALQLRDILKGMVSRGEIPDVFGGAA